MIAIPSVDLYGSGSSNAAAARDGQARKPAPFGVARDLADIGFSRLLVVNRAAPPGTFTNTAAVEDVLRGTTARVQVGGVSATSDIEQLLRSGVDSVVVNDRGIEEPDWLADVSDLYPDEIAVTTDVRDRRVVRRGWVRTLPVDILDLVEELNALPLRELLVTIPGLDGTMRFGELSLLEDLAERSRCPVLVAGGIATIEDLRALEHRGVAGVVIEAEKLLDGTFNGRDIAHEFGA